MNLMSFPHHILVYKTAVITAVLKATTWHITYKLMDIIAQLQQVLVQLFKKLWLITLCIVVVAKNL